MWTHFLYTVKKQSFRYGSINKIIIFESVQLVVRFGIQKQRFTHALVSLLMFWDFTKLVLKCYHLI